MKWEVSEFDPRLIDFFFDGPMLIAFQVNGVIYKSRLYKGGRSLYGTNIVADTSEAYG